MTKLNFKKCHVFNLGSIPFSNTTFPKIISDILLNINKSSKINFLITNNIENNYYSLFSNLKKLNIRVEDNMFNCIEKITKYIKLYFNDH